MFVLTVVVTNTDEDDPIDTLHRRVAPGVVLYCCAGELSCLLWTRGCGRRSTRDASTTPLHADRFPLDHRVHLHSPLAQFLPPSQDHARPNIMILPPTITPARTDRHNNNPHSQTRPRNTIRNSRNYFRGPWPCSKCRTCTLLQLHDRSICVEILACPGSPHVFVDFRHLRAEDVVVVETLQLVGEVRFVLF